TIRPRSVVAAFGPYGSLSRLRGWYPRAPIWVERRADFIDLRTPLRDSFAGDALVDCAAAPAPAAGALVRSPFLRTRSVAAARTFDAGASLAAHLRHLVRAVAGAQRAASVDGVNAAIRGAMCLARR